MKTPPAATAVTGGVITSRNSRDRTPPFFSARREAGLSARPAPRRRAPRARGATLRARLARAAAPTAPTGMLVSRDVGLIAALGKPRARLALDSTALAPFTMRPGGVQRHASAVAELTRLLLPGRRFDVHSVTDQASAHTLTRANPQMWTEYRYLGNRRRPTWQHWVSSRATVVSRTSEFSRFRGGPHAAGLGQYPRFGLEDRAGSPLGGSADLRLSCSGRRLVGCRVWQWADHRGRRTRHRHRPGPRRCPGRAVPAARPEGHCQGLPVPQRRVPGPHQRQGSDCGR